MSSKITDVALQLSWQMCLQLSNVNDHSSKQGLNNKGISPDVTVGWAAGSPQIPVHREGGDLPALMGSGAENSPLKKPGFFCQLWQV